MIVDSRSLGQRGGARGAVRRVAIVAGGKLEPIRSSSPPVSPSVKSGCESWRLTDVLGRRRRPHRPLRGGRGADDHAERRRRRREGARTGDAAPGAGVGRGARSSTRPSRAAHPVLLRGTVVDGWASRAWTWARLRELLRRTLDGVQTGACTSSPYGGRAAAAAAHAAALGQLERRRALRRAGGGGARRGGDGRQLRPGIGGGAARVARAHRGLRQGLLHFGAVPDALAAELQQGNLLYLTAADAAARMQYTWMSSPGLRTHPLRLGPQRLRPAHRAQAIRAVGAEPDGAPLPVPAAPPAVAQVARRLRGARHLAAAVRQLLARRGDRRRRGT